MTLRQEFFINGSWVSPAGGELLEVINPATETSLQTIPQGTRADVDQAVQAAKQAFPGFSQSSVASRLALLDRLAAVYQERSDEMASTVSAEMGAPLWFAREAHVPAALGNLRTARRVLADFAFESSIGETQILHEAAGVCAMITPWNWPINQIACKVAPALAAGCTMVLKPSEVAPLNAILFAEIAEEAGVPEGVFNLIHGDGEGVGAALVAHPDVEVVSFTGSTRAGVSVAQGAAAGIKRVALELGGKSANVILESADLEKAVVHGVRQCFENSGQSCNAPSRMLVPRGDFERAAEMARQVAEGVVVGAPEHPDTHLGPVVSRRQFDRIQTLIKSGIEDGAKVIVGGEARPEGLTQGYYVRPTVFGPVDNRMRIAQEEIFGPVLSMIPYDGVEDAIHIANDTKYGLSGYVSGDPTEARGVARRLRTGNVHLNGARQNIAAPFGGYRQSGVGRERGVFGLQEFLEVKAVYN